MRKEDLRYLTLSFWGFDGRQHTGELLVNASAADAMVTVFGKLWAARFPLEEMRISSRADLDRAPTGDGNNTSAFVCRPTRGLSTWSAHAYGIALDINPFCNPYLRGDLVLPELAGAYVNRSRRSPGMIFSDDVVTRAFASVGWTWGGSWRSPKDLMHFSANGR
ncbi:M15 family metallopeptidase [Allokutzneria sp. A3M-2-11 16]|uniref:M15 family metallopeptidase n=1 Tax=Allokutzneria sp. A3M-2-11 16 TaxID=2962043 RepID=UPI0027E29BD5|nr:M15 family metallopeptidase [Allokutzneria sp. A3M-2-11 16]